MRLEEANGPAQVLRLLRVGHVGHLVGNRLEPGLVGLDVRYHLGQSVAKRSAGSMLAHEGGVSHGYALLPDGRLLDELLAKDNALVAPFQTLFHHGAGHAYHTAAHHEAFVVEVAH